MTIFLRTLWECSGEILQISSRIFVTVLTYNPFLPLSLSFSFSFSSFLFLHSRRVRSLIYLPLQNIFFEIFLSNYESNYSINIFFSYSFFSFFLFISFSFTLFLDSRRMKKRGKKEKRRSGNKTWFFLNSSFSVRRESQNWRGKNRTGWKNRTREERERGESLPSFNISPSLEGGSMS